MNNFIKLHDYSYNTSILIRKDEIASVQETIANGRRGTEVVLKDKRFIKPRESMSEIQRLLISDEDIPQVKKTERGWGGHFIGANECRFRRNTLLEFGDEKIVVSSVGLYQPRKEGEFETLGLGRYFETMAWHADLDDKKYHDADYKQQIFFDSPWATVDLEADDEANEKHDAVVEELSKKLERGLISRKPFLELNGL